MAEKQETEGSRDHKGQFLMVTAGTGWWGWDRSPDLVLVLQ